jgi:phosphatidylglycerol:prolipoprotein diacylglycerol transferase
VPWAFIFKSDPDALARHPSQLYQAGLEGILLFLVLQIGVARFGILKRPGQAIGIFIAGYGVMRWIGEQFREPDAGLILNLTRGELYSLPMIIIGLGILVLTSLRKPNSQSNPSA